MKKSFATQRFLSLLVVGTLSMVVEYLILLSDNIIAGNFLGVYALSAITLMTPFFNFVVFVSILISIGTTVMVSHEVGRGRQDDASRYFGQGMILASAAGALLTCAFLFVFYSGEGLLFDVSPDVNGYIKEYFQYLCFLPLVMPLNSLLYCVLMTQGGERLCAAVSVVNVISNVGLSVLLCRKMGIGGISLATCISNALQVLVFICYLFRKRSALRFAAHFRVRDAIKVFTYSLNDAGGFLFMALMQFIMNLFLLWRFGESVIAVFAVVMNILILLNASFDGIGQSILPLISVYHGEGSQKSIAKTMKTANITALIEGVVVSLLLLIFADMLPKAFGITGSDLLHKTAAAIRIYSIAAVCFPFIMLYSSYYLYIGKVRIALGITTSYLFAAPVALGILFGVLFGLNGVWAGMALSSIVTVSGMAAFMKKRFSKKTFPLLLDREQLQRELSYDVPKTKDGIMSLVYNLERDMIEKGAPKSKVLKIMLMIEETQMLALETDDGSHAMIECNVFLDDAITVIVRDSGKHNDFTKDAPPPNAFAPDNISRRIVAMHKDKQYILTSGRNRIIMKF